MTSPILTGHWVRPRPGFKTLHLLGFLAITVAAAVAVAILVDPLLFGPALIVPTLALYLTLAARFARHRRTVIADIEQRHGIAVPEHALQALLRDRETVFTHAGRRYRVEPSHRPGPGNDWEQAKIVLVPMGADAATLFGHP